MNRNPSGLLFSLCIDGFVKYKTAEGLSQRTVDSYEWVLRKWMDKIGDQPIGKITSADVLDYMTYLRTEYVPHTFAKPNPAHDAPTRKLSPRHCETWITFKLSSVGRLQISKSIIPWKAFRGRATKKHR
jgi:integrase/recombinase XerD